MYKSRKTRHHPVQTRIKTNGRRNVRRRLKRAIHTRLTDNLFVRKKKKDFNILFCYGERATNFTACVIDVTDRNSEVIYTAAVAD